MARKVEAPEMLTPGEVARIYRVDPKTVNRWAASGRLTYVRTLGGHRRYYAAEVQALLAATEQRRDGGQR